MWQALKGLKIGWHNVVNSKNTVHVYAPTCGQFQHFNKTFTLSSTDGKHLQLGDMGGLFDVIMAVCYTESNDMTKFHIYEKEARARGGVLGPDVDAIFKSLRNAEDPVKPASTWTFASPPAVAPIVAPVKKSKIKAKTALPHVCSHSLGLIKPHKTDPKRRVKSPKKAKVVKILAKKSDAGTGHVLIKPLKKVQKKRVKLPKNAKNVYINAKKSKACIGRVPIKPPKKVLKKRVKLPKLAPGLEKYRLKNLPLLKRENVPETNFAMRNLDWTPWVPAIVYGSTDTTKLKGPWKKCSIGDSKKLVSLPQKLPKPISCPTLFEVAVKEPGSHRRRHVMYSRISTQTMTVSNWESRLLTSCAKAQVREVLKQGCQVWVRSGQLSGKADVDSTKAQLKRYDYAWSGMGLGVRRVLHKSTVLSKPVSEI